MDTNSKPLTEKEVFLNIIKMREIAVKTTRISAGHAVTILPWKAEEVRVRIVV